jgi:hypothetical protein
MKALGSAGGAITMLQPPGSAGGWACFESSDRPLRNRPRPEAGAAFLRFNLQGGEDSFVVSDFSMIRVFRVLANTISVEKTRL